MATNPANNGVPPNPSAQQISTPAVPPPPPPPPVGATATTMMNGGYGVVRGNIGSQMLTQFEPYNTLNPLNPLNALSGIPSANTITPQLNTYTSVMHAIPSHSGMNMLNNILINNNENNTTVGNYPNTNINRHLNGNETVGTTAAVALNAINAARLQAAAIARNRTLLSAQAQAQAQAAAAVAAAAAANRVHNNSNNSGNNGKSYDSQAPLIPNQSLLQQQHPAYRHFNAAVAAAAAATAVATANMNSLSKHNGSVTTASTTNNNINNNNNSRNNTTAAIGSRYDPFNAYGSSTKSGMINSRMSSAKDEASYHEQLLNASKYSGNYNNNNNNNSNDNKGANSSLNDMNDNNNGSNNGKKRKKKAIATHTSQLRSAAGETWVDATMTEWPENDFRIFCGDLGNEVSDQMLTSAFSKYASFAKAKVVRDKRTGKSKGYGFVSFLDPNDFIRAFKEMNGKYVGNRPIKLRKSKWKDRQKVVKHFKTIE